MTSRYQHFAGRKGSNKGFSLLELLVAMGVFLTVSAVSFTLFAKHQALLSAEQLTVGLNIGLRNALSQIQLDVVNAGDGLILGQNVPAWPVGVTIMNTNPTPAQCFAASTYNAEGVMTSPPVYQNACFDQLNVILADRTTPPLQPQTAAGGSINTDTGPNTFYACAGLINNGVCTPNSIINPATNTPFTPTTLAAKFITSPAVNADQLLFVKGCAGGAHPNPNISAVTSGTATANSSGCQFTTARLVSVAAASSPPAPSTNYIVITFGQTQSPGPLNSPNPPSPPYAGSNIQCANSPPSTCNDQYNMTACNGVGSCFTSYTALTDTFGPGDFVVRLAPITYSVDASNPQDPKLMRTQAGVQNVVMDQVIGFKVGATLWNNNNTSTFQYNYDAANYFPIPYDYSLIRSIRVSIIGRTQPNPTNPYQNPFDKGPYQIRGNSIIVDPRNLTMNQD
jgi:prepilin-type N-terminal cleavage/methylation domain-containing protein